MALFKVLAGRHVQDGKTYSKGDIVETNVDLVATFGANKFSREVMLEQSQNFRQQTESEPVAEPNVEPDAELSPSVLNTPKLGTDVSEEFSNTVDQGISVFKKAVQEKGKKRKSWLFFVVDNDKDPATPLNEVGLKKVQVQSFIDDLFEDEGEEE